MSKRLRRKSMRNVLVGLGLCAAAPVYATTQYWDADASNNGVLGGTGTWNSSLTNWSDTVANTTPADRAFTSGNDATFQGTTGTITLGSTISAGVLTLGVNDTIDLAGNNLTLTGLSGTTGSIYSTTTAATLTVNIASGTNTYTGSLGLLSANAMTFTKTGSGTLVLSSTSLNYRGQATNNPNFGVNDGTVQFGGLGSSTNATLSVGDGIGAAGSALLQMNSAGGSLYGTISTLSTTINSDGKIDLAANALLKSSVVSNAYTITFLNSGGSIVGNGALTTGGANSLVGTSNGSTTARAMTITGAGSVALAGGNLTIDSAGTSLSGTQTGAASQLNLNNGGTLNTQGGNILFASMDKGGTTSAAVTVLASTGGGSIDTGAGAVIFGTGGSDGVTTSTNLLPGSSQSITVVSGTLSIAGNIAIGQSGLTGNAATNQSNRTLTLGVASGSGLAISAAIGNGTGSTGNGISVSGSGTVTLSGSNGYTGGTVISGGRLVIASTGSINTTSAVTLSGGELAYNSATALSKAITFTSGTLSGTGTVGAVSAGASSTVAPGADSTTGSVGTLHTANLSLTSGSTYKADINLNAVAGAAGGTTIYASDTLDVTGSVTLGGALLLNFVNSPQSGINKTVILVLNDDNADTIGTTFSSITPVSGGPVTYQVFYAYNAATGATTGGNDVAITFTSVPEPSSMSLLGLAAGGLLARRRRRGRE